ncbi:MFS transporter [Chloroflexota bacterium]
MIKRVGIPKIFFGWWIALTSGILTFWGQGFGHFGFSALFKPIASELGFNRAVTSVAASVGRLEGGLASPVVGWITDKFGPRWMALSGTLIVGLSLILMNFVNSLWAFYLIWGILLGIGANIGFSLPLEKTITNWFVKKRGRALSIRQLFFGLAAVLMLPLVAWITSTQGWRMTCVIGGIVMWIIGLPLVWFFIKQRRPEYYGLLPDGMTTEEAVEITQMIDRGVKYATEIEEVEFTLRQAMRTPAYWLLMVANASFMVVPQVIIIHAVPFLTDMGIGPVKAAVMIGIMSSGVIPGMFFSMFVADRVKRQHLRFLLAAAYFLQLISFSSFLLKQTLVMAYPIFILHHFAAGINHPINSVISARYFGRKAFGSIRGTLTMFILPVSVMAPIYAGWVYDTTGSYIAVFFLCAVLLMFSTLIILFAAPPKPPTQITEIDNIL